MSKGLPDYLSAESWILGVRLGELAVAQHGPAAHDASGRCFGCRLGEAGRTRSAHIIKFRPIGIERIAESALQLTDRSREILQHDTLPFAFEGTVWACCRCRLLVVRTKGRVQSARTASIFGEKSLKIGANGRIGD